MRSIKIGEKLQQFILAKLSDKKEVVINEEQYEGENIWGKRNSKYLCKILNWK